MVGADVVAVVVVVTLEVGVVVDTAFLDEEPATGADTAWSTPLVDTAVVDVTRVEAAADDEVDVDEVDAKTVWPASSVRPIVASNDPLVNQKVTARALRIPRRRRAPERSEDDIDDPVMRNDHDYEDGAPGFELSQRFLGTSSVVR